MQLCFLRGAAAPRRRRSGAFGHPTGVGHAASTCDAGDSGQLTIVDAETRMVDVKRMTNNHRRDAALPRDHVLLLIVAGVMTNVEAIAMAFYGSLVACAPQGRVLLVSAVDRGGFWLRSTLGFGSHFLAYAALVLVDRAFLLRCLQHCSYRCRCCNHCFSYSFSVTFVTIILVAPIGVMASQG